MQSSTRPCSKEESFSCLIYNSNISNIVAWWLYQTLITRLLPYSKALFIQVLTILACMLHTYMSEMQTAMVRTFVALRGIHIYLRLVTSKTILLYFVMAKQIWIFIIARSIQYYVVVFKSLLL